MKKLKFLIMLLLLIPMGVKASSYYIAMEKGDNITYYPYEIVKYNHAVYFSISPLENYSINNRNYVNNLAYLSTFNASIEFEASLQALIWQDTHPDYKVYLVDENYNYFDNSYYLNELIFKRMELLNQEITFRDATIKLNPNEALTLSTNANLSHYNIDSDILLNNYTIKLNYSDKGTYTINFTNKDFRYYNNLITSYQFNLEPFQITVIVDDFKDININTYKNKELITSNILIYDEQDNLYETVNGTNNSLRLKLGKYKFVDQITKEEIIYDIASINEVSFIHHDIFGIKTNMDITKICQVANCFNFTKENDLYIFDAPITNGFYEIYSDNEVITYNLNLTENYINDPTLGLLYTIDYEEPIKDSNNNEDELTNSDETINNNNDTINNEDPTINNNKSDTSNNETDIAIAIPDTAINTYNITKIIVYKKEN